MNCRPGSLEFTYIDSGRDGATVLEDAVLMFQVAKPVAIMFFGDDIAGRAANFGLQL